MLVLDDRQRLASYCWNLAGRSLAAFGHAAGSVTESVPDWPPPTEERSDEVSTPDSALNHPPT
jgi:hypothetical protein